jgi:DNA-binding transcriptional regulator YhcF (GntR family)
MYFTNDQFWKILRCSPETVSRALSKIEKDWIIKTSRKVKVW